MRGDTVRSHHARDANPIVRRVRQDAQVPISPPTLDERVVGRAFDLAGHQGFEAGGAKPQVVAPRLQRLGGSVIGAGGDGGQAAFGVGQQPGPGRLEVPHQFRDTPQRNIGAVFRHQPGILPEHLIVGRSISSRPRPEEQLRVAARFEWNAELTAGHQWRGGFLPGLGPVRPADVTDRVVLEQHLLPGLDIGRGEGLLAELATKRFEQRGGLGRGQGLFEPGKVTGAQPLAAAAPLQGVEVAGERNCPPFVLHRSRTTHIVDERRGEGVAGVELADPGQCLVGPVLGGLAGGEPHPVVEQHEVARDFASGVEILGEQRGRHDKCRTSVGEAFARGPVHGEFAGRIERGDPGQIAERVAILVVGEPAEHDWPRITGTRQRDVGESLPRPVGELFLPRGGKRLGLLGGHLAQGQLFLHAFPDIGVTTDLGERLEPLEVEFTLLFFGRVAGDAVLGQQGPDLLAEGVGPQRRGGTGDERDEEQERGEPLHARISSTTRAPSTPVRRKSSPAWRWVSRS